MLTDIFSHICGQRSCFVVDGAVLPVCQRCLGLYLGSLLTAGWLAATGLWRRGLGSWSVFLVNELTLLAAMLGGLGLWGDSPMWKLTCGLWTGHVAMLWLIGGGGHLWRLSRPSRAGQLPWRKLEKLQGVTAPLLLAALAWVVPSMLPIGGRVWALAAACGAVVLAAASVGAVVALGRYVGVVAVRCQRRMRTARIHLR
jgi:hypothetical protein